MYAIIATGGKQYKVEQNKFVEVEKLSANVGDKVTFDVVLFNDDKTVHVGNPLVKATVEGEVLAQSKAKKIIVYKYKAKKNERKRQGHRQPFTVVKITKMHLD